MQILEINPDIRLHRMQLSDSEDIFKAIDCQRDYLRVWLPFVDNLRTVEDEADFIRGVLSVPEERQELLFIIRYQGVFAGLAGFKDTDRLNGRTEIGYWLGEVFQGKGIMTMVVKELCRLAFRELGMHRIQIRCAAGNQRSRNIPLRLGFMQEGIERDGELLVDGHYTDLVVYSRLATDK